jgi:hypothetical protein
MFGAIVSCCAFGFGLIYGSPVIVFAAVSLGYCVALSGVES